MLFIYVRFGPKRKGPSNAWDRQLRLLQQQSFLQMIWLLQQTEASSARESSGGAARPQGTFLQLQEKLQQSFLQLLQAAANNHPAVPVLPSYVPYPN
jgi:hypothetical protein